MKRNCCGKCEDLSTTKTENSYVNEHRKNHKRWNEKYSDFEIENIKKVLLDNYNDADGCISSGILTVPSSIKSCIINLQENSGRPFYGFLSKLHKLGILNKKIFRANKKTYIKYFMNKNFFPINDD